MSSESSHPHSIEVTSKPPASVSREVLLQYALALVEQAITLLGGSVIVDEYFSKPSTLMPGSTIGKHFRHIHDHFRLLLKPNKPNEICYDIRARNTPMASNRQLALENFVQVREWINDCLAKITSDPPSPASKSSQCLGSPRTLNIVLGDDEISADTTFEREVWFVSMHTIHHFALIRAISIYEFDIKLPEEFGFAPSTLAALSKL